MWQENFLKLILIDLIEIWSRKYIEKAIDINININKHNERTELMNFIYSLQSLNFNIKITKEMLNIQSP